MSDIVEELHPRNHRMVDGVSTPHVEVPNSILECAIAEIESLRAEHEALIAATKALMLTKHLSDGADLTKSDEAWRAIDAALAAIRAVGVSEVNP